MTDPIKLRLSPELEAWVAETNAALVAGVVELNRRLQPLVEAWRADMVRFAERVNRAGSPDA